MQDVSNSEGRTVLFVSHNLMALSSLCNKGIYLKNGQVRSQGEIEGTLSQYTREGSDSLMTEWNGNAGDEFVKIDRTKVYCADSANGFFTDKNIVIEIEGEVLKPVYGLIMGFWLYSQFDYQLAYSLFDDTDPSVDIRTQQPGKFKKQFIIPANTLAHGSYRVQFDFGIHNLKLIVQILNFLLKIFPA
jgi:lipopolysaccharide transport system ATP-binding protein